ncbi:MAG: nuclear transport factor 2 family protein [Candidatus Obscuribacterales bacterium]|nr:nuclear transport factor 2 family protein [Candidatus Obscuribacterales bacterium]
MNSVQAEIEQLEEQLRLAELGPDPEFFEKYIDDKMIFVANGKTSAPKKQIVNAHKPEQCQKFTRVEMSELSIVEHGSTAVVTCTGTYEGPSGTHVLRFMRVWSLKIDGWRIVAAALV